MATAFQNVTGYTAPMFEFEENFDHDGFLEWIQQNWTQSFWYASFYVAFIFGGRKYMADRPRFTLRWPLAIWSLILGVFSIMGAVRTIPELVYMLRKYGLEQSICHPSYFYGPTAFWAYMFTISKAYELGDTVFIVFRKQPLIFLHWYHHITVMIYVFYSYTDHTAPGRWFMVMNYTVHSVMYSYYTLKAMRFYIPKWVSMMITSLQLLQMVVGLFINVLVYQYKQEGHYCQQSFENLRYCFCMYASYFILFAYFFYNAYLKPKVAAVAKKHDLEKTASSLAKKLQ
jgi:elongation of very long chain fatty acids protein 6